MPGPVVPLPSKNAILDLHWAGCSPIFCSSKCLPSCGLAGSARGIVAVQGGSCGWRIPVAASCPRETRQQHSPWHWGLGTQSCGCCTQPAPLPAKNLQSSSVTPCHGAQHCPTTVQGWEATSRSSAPGWGAGCSGPPDRWPCVPSPVRPGAWLASTAAGAANRHGAGAKEGHREALAWHKGKIAGSRGKKWREGATCHLPRWGRCSAAASAPSRVDPHPGPSAPGSATEHG